jgi:glycerol-3-phosphate dehydrogenase
VNGTGGDPARLARHGRIVDHARDGVPGLLSVVGVKYTTARLMAERAVNRVFERLGRRAPRSMSRSVPLHGADRTAVTTEEVLAHLEPGEHAGDPIAIVRAEVRHAIRAEMAQTLCDVVFRRTGLAGAGDPGGELLEVAARAAGVELGWSRERTDVELRQVHGRFGMPR